MRRCTILPCVLLAALAGCATPAARPAEFAAAPAQATNPAGTLQGRIVDVREVDIGQNAGSRAGVDAVLAALSQPLSPANLALQEVVIQPADGDAVSLGGAFPGLAVGQRVIIIAGPTTGIAPGD